MPDVHQDQLAVFLPGTRRAFAPGESLEVTLLWALAAKPATIDVRLFWVTRGKGTEDIEVVDRVSIREPAAAGEERCTFVLPAAPWSFSGKLISLVWGVEAVCTAPDLAAREEFVLAPGGAELRLDESAAELRQHG